MLLDTWQYIASALPWQHFSFFSASSCMEFTAVKIHGQEYKMASGVSRSLSMLASLWERFSSQVEHLWKVTFKIMHVLNFHVII